ncbi:MAG TPA: hypothetical protein V6C84_03525 [Coleofasciculaceae cyanobacterium]|jgi:hypothetical protein
MQKQVMIANDIHHLFNLVGVNSPPLCGETSSLQCQPLADEQNGFHTPLLAAGSLIQLQTLVNLREIIKPSGVSLKGCNL